MSARIRRFCRIIFILFAIITMMVLFSTVAGLNTIVLADDNISFSQNELTVDLGSDTIDNYSLTIRDYPAQLIATKGCIDIEQTLFSSFYLNNCDQDDPIVGIVPKELFFVVGETLDIGDEYGYFISTTQKSSGNFLSTVLVFDISTNTDLVNTVDRVIVEVEPIFQYEYVGLTTTTNSEQFGIYLVEYEYLDEPCVIPNPSKMANSSGALEPQYEMTESFYLKDISFGATLFNEQALNCGDVGYSAYDDYGYYFTALDYSYNGKYREYGDFDEESLAWVAADMFMIGLEAWKVVPGIGNAISLIGAVYQGVTLTTDWVKIFIDNSSATNGEIQIASKQITTTCFYQNRNDQLAHYVDSNGNPALTKAASILMNTSDEQSVWYGIGDDVTAYFTVGNGATDSMTPYYTRFVDQLGVKVVRASDDSVVTLGTTIIEDSLRVPEYKEAGILQEAKVYMLSDGEDHIVIDNINFTSNYNVYVELSSNANVSVNGQNGYGNNLNFTVYAEEGDSIGIDLSGNEVGLNGTIMITPADSSNISSIDGYARYLFEAELDGVKNIQTSHPDLQIDGIYIYEDGQLIEDNSFVPFNPATVLAYPFEGDTTYYIAVRNTSANVITNESVQINDIAGISAGQNVTISTNTKAMYFVNPYNNPMSFQLTLPQQDGTGGLTVFNENGLAIASATVLSTGAVEYSWVLDSEEKCYIFFDLTDSATITISLDENHVKWAIDGEYIQGYSIFLPRGESYELQLLYSDGDIEFELTTNYNIASHAEYFTFVNDILTITYDAPFSYDITIVPISYPDATLRISPSMGREDYSYTVVLEKEGGTGGHILVLANYNRDMPTATAPTRVGYEFLGYYAGSGGTGKQYYDAQMRSVNKWDIEDDVPIYAHWEPIVYTITYDLYSAAVPSSNPTTYTIETPTITLRHPDRTGYTGEWSMPTIPKGTTGNLTITYEWRRIRYRILIHHAIYEPWLPISIDLVSSMEFYLNYDESREVTAKTLKGYNFLFWVYYDTRISGMVDHHTHPILSYENTINIQNLTTNDGMSYDVVACYEEKECVATGSLITLASGQQVPVETLIGDELLLAWNIYTGQFEEAPILFIDNDPTRLYKVVNLRFSDGTTTKVIGEHGFWDVDLNEYVYLDEDATNYIGHWFNKQTTNSDGSLGWTQVQLTDVVITEEYTEAWSPVTQQHLCYYVNGMLSMPGGISGLFNIFEVNPETMMVDEEKMALDIAQYGLFTYEEFVQLVPVTEDVFNAVNAQYLKVAIGKGLISVDELQSLVNRYADFLF